MDKLNEFIQALKVVNATYKAWVDKIETAYQKQYNDLADDTEYCLAKQKFMMIRKSKDQKAINKAFAIMKKAEAEYENRLAKAKALAKPVTNSGAFFEAHPHLALPDPTTYRIAITEPFKGSAPAFVAGERFDITRYFDIPTGWHMYHAIFDTVEVNPPVALPDPSTFPEIWESWDALYDNYVEGTVKISTCMMERVEELKDVEFGVEYESGGYVWEHTHCPTYTSEMKYRPVKENETPKFWWGYRINEHRNCLYHIRIKTDNNPDTDGYLIVNIRFWD